MKMHIPMRMCVSCRQMKPKGELIRIVKQDNGIKIDKNGKIQCRGVYMCRSSECVGMGIKKKSLERAFKSAVDKSVYEMIEKEISGCIDG